jgi:hypothetical protein
LRIGQRCLPVFGEIARYDRRRHAAKCRFAGGQKLPRLSGKKKTLRVFGIDPNIIDSG